MENLEDPTRLRSYVKSIAMKYVRDDQDAEDVTQDALLLAHRYRASFRGESRFSTWLYRVTATAALMFLRKQKRVAREIPSSATGDDDTSLLDHHASPRDLRAEVIAREPLDEVQRAGA